MRRLLLLCLVLPATAVAAPARAPAVAPSLAGTPVLFRDGGGMVRLVFLTDAALPRRYDGLIGGGAQLAGHDAPLGKAGEQPYCYTAAARFRARIGRRYRVVIALRQDDPAPEELRLTLRRSRAVQSNACVAGPR